MMCVCVGCEGGTHPFRGRVNNNSGTQHRLFLKVTHNFKRYNKQKGVPRPSWPDLI